MEANTLMAPLKSFFSLLIKQYVFFGTDERSYILSAKIDRDYDRSFIFFNCLSTYANFYWISSCLSFSLLILSSPTSSWFHPSIEFHLIFHFIMFICIHTIIFLYKYINMTLSNVLVCVCNLFFSSFYLDSFFRFSAHFILSLPYITHVNNAVYILSCFCLGHVRLKLYVKIYMTYGFTSCLTKIES